MDDSNEFYIFKEDYIFNSQVMQRQLYQAVKKMGESSGNTRE